LKRKSVQDKKKNRATVIGSNNSITSFSRHRQRPFLRLGKLNEGFHDGLRAWWWDACARSITAKEVGPIFVRYSGCLYNAGRTSVTPGATGRASSVYSFET